MACNFDRLETLRDSDSTVGIDYVYVHKDQVTLDVYFHYKSEPPPAIPGDLLSGLNTERIKIHLTKQGRSQGIIPVAGIQWINGNTVLRITTEYPGGFADYSIDIEHSNVDSYYNDVVFSFKAGCESDLDCKKKEHECPEEEPVDFPVDYLARDFLSFRKALLDFASLRYPDWQDRLEADAGIMLVEVMSALGDELSYVQDRYAREAYLETATQRRSLRHHARLVDYEIHEGLAASTLLDVTVKNSDSGNLQAGSDIWAESDSGEKISYEIGHGLDDIINKETFAVDSEINSLSPHIWDEDDTCLPVGATQVYLDGWHKNALPFNETTADDRPFRWMLLKTNPDDPGKPERRWMVRVTDIQEVEDLLATGPSCDHQITRLAWEADQALLFEMDLTTLEIRGNLVPVTAGQKYEKYFVTGVDATDDMLSRTVERSGANESTTHLYSLPESDKTPLCRLGEQPRSARPEVRIFEVLWNGSEWEEKTGLDWEWRMSLLGVHSSQPDDRHFTLEDGMWRRLIGYQRIGEEIIHMDHAGSAGKTIRFGDDEFGLVPDKGTCFKVVYRLGNGRIGNVSADSLVHFDATAIPIIDSVTNPLAVENGQDPETSEEVKQLAPQAFRAVTYRAVRNEDYSEAAERLDWVQRAGARFRWTGSWLSGFVTPDPYGAVGITDGQREELASQIDRFRQAGREAFVSDPVYADIDLKITVCVESYAYRGEVKERVLKALLGNSKKQGFFSPDNFTFGDRLRRSQLEATIQRVQGVRAVSGIEIRRRGHFDWQLMTEPYFPVGDYEVIRLENDTKYPDRGSLRLKMEGGA